MSRPSLNRSNDNTVNDQFSKLQLGNLLLGQMVQQKRRLNPTSLGVGSYTLGTLHAMQLPGNARACTINRATVRAGGVTGELTVVAYGTAPTSGQIAVAPNGDIVTLASDAITDMDVNYVAERGDVIETFFSVASNVLTIPSGSDFLARGIILLLEAEAMSGTSTGKKIVLVPGSGAPSAGQCRLNIAKGTVTFASADAVTRARIKILVAPKATNDLQTNLGESEDQFA